MPKESETELQQEADQQYSQLSYNEALDMHSAEEAGNITKFSTSSLASVNAGIASDLFRKKYNDHLSQDNKNNLCLELINQLIENYVRKFK